MPSYLVDGAGTPIGRFRRSLGALGAVELATGPAAMLRDRYGSTPSTGASSATCCRLATARTLPVRSRWRAGSRRRPTRAHTQRRLPVLDDFGRARCQYWHARPAQAWLVGGADSMSQADVALGDRRPTIVFADGLTCALESRSDGAVADDDDALGVTRADDDAMALASFRRADAAQRRGFFDGEIVPVLTASGQLARDEGLRATSAEALAGLSPAFSVRRHRHRGQRLADVRRRRPRDHRRGGVGGRARRRAPRPHRRVGPATSPASTARCTSARPRRSNGCSPSTT